MNIGTKIAACRKAAGLSQEGLAAKLNLSRQAVSRWETGDAIPDTEKVVQLSRIFEVSTDYLLIDEMEMPKAMGSISLPQWNPVLERRRHFRIAFEVTILVVGVLLALAALILAGLWAKDTTFWETELGRYGTGLFRTWRLALLLFGGFFALTGIWALFREYRRDE